MHTNNTTHTNKPRGQSLVEFALLLPILLMLILGAMDFARMFTTKIVLTNAAREGANFLTRNPSDFTGYLTVIENELQNITLDEDQQPTYACTFDENGKCESGTKVSVTVTKKVDLIFGGFLETFGVTSGPIQLSSTVEMMVQ